MKDENQKTKLKNHTKNLKILKIQNGKVPKASNSAQKALEPRLNPLLNRSRQNLKK